MAKAKRLLGFVPKYNVFDSIKNIKAWIDAGGLLESTEKRVFGGGLNDSKNDNLRNLQ
jgi:hypothetical protein